MTTLPTSPPHAAPRSGRKQRTRDKITDAALLAFRDRGYELATAEQIAQTAGISRSNFYLHFKSKAELVVSMLDSLEPEVVAMYSTLDGLVKSSEPEIRAWVFDTAKLWDRDSHRFETLERALAVEPLVSERWARTLQHAADAMPQYLCRFEEGARRTRARARLLTLMFQYERSMYFTVVRESGLDRREMVEALADQWSEMLQMGAPRSS
ncbi:TetR/AcrR family transcriptional regulator [Cryobacterium sp. N19]|uniref:TetR/AcrR family transcriptional regulator n=1 Tax=Cryobacterium sp. N19 TaxID=2048288 RepID=UPI000CE31BC8|nr:TetR/AcrR family transcriptional regulator [Cryobacterium sp. N19]